MLNPSRNAGRLRLAVRPHSPPPRPAERVKLRGIVGRLTISVECVPVGDAIAHACDRECVATRL
eukprot:4465143-Pleurochrysis_carterae.AAC.1